MFDFVICASTNLFRMYLIHRFITTFLGKLEKNKIKEFLFYVCFYLVNTALFWEFHTIWINILCNLAGIGMIVWLHTKSAKTILFVTGSIYLICMGCDVFVMLGSDYRDGQAYSQVYAILVVFLIFVCELITEKIVTSRKKEETLQNTPLILVPLCSIAIVTLLIYTNTYTMQGMTIICVGMLTVNFFVLYLYNLLSRAASQKYETEMLKQRVQVYANQLDVILQSEEKIKALRHDMKHHMNELKLLANKYEIAEIQDYIDSMQGFVRNPDEIVDSGNLEIDSVLNYMLQKAREELGNVTVNIMLPEALKHSFDINVLLGNLLENAIEAAAQTERKYLRVDIALKRDVLKIKVANSFLPESIVKEKKGSGTVLLTTKREKEKHGIGLKNVKRIVEMYNGMMEVTDKDDIFCVRLILYMSGAENEI